MQRSTARDYVAIGRSLEELGAIDQGFREGRFSWSRVRLLVRIATEQTEAAWAAWARERTVTEIERHTKVREKGQLPTDAERRRLHNIKLSVRARLDVVAYDLWTQARMRIDHETRRDADARASSFLLCRDLPQEVDASWWTRCRVARSLALDPQAMHGTLEQDGSPAQERGTWEVHGPRRARA